jgi:eukaryotic-like serine/threonine-protein kinase
MTPEEWQHVRSILESALELEPASRAKFLDQACAEDSIRVEVELLIHLHEEAGTNFLNTPPNPAALFEEEVRFRLVQGKRIGAYEIIGEIAQGGMGAVYRAVRADGQYTQQVALKIVRAELGAELTAARFRNERQILASLDHPNIAKILDGGTTVEGVPYFVMELIDGLPITEYCDQNKLSVDARLRLFLAVCSAVHYAHQRLIIHRDIKPTNILITADGVPKLLDFGIAKLLDPGSMSEHPTVTAGAWMLTPAYASPEQLRGEIVTTATDEYSLGLLLYELLTGYNPYNMPGRTPHEIAELASNTEPQRLSLAVQKSETASKTPDSEQLYLRRGTTPAKLAKRLAGDLDNIVLMALRKEPSRRYASVEQFAEDLQRHLARIPVRARHDTAWYRTSKFIARHKAGVLTATFAVFATFVAFAITLYEARVARQERLSAERRFNDVRALANSLMFEVHDSIRALPGATAARKLVVQRAQEYLDRLAAEPKSDPSLLRELAAAYDRLGGVLGDRRDANLGDSQQSLRNYRRAAELREAVVAARPSDLDYRRELAGSYMALATALQPGEEFLRKALAILEPLAAANPGNTKIQFALAKALERRGQNFAVSGKLPDARADYEKSLAIYGQLSKADPKESQYLIEVAFAHKHLGGLLIRENQFPAALEQYRLALPIDEAQLRAEPQNTMNQYSITFTYSDIGFILGKQGDIDGALDYYRRARDIRSAQAAADPQDSRARGGLAQTYVYLTALNWQKGDLTTALEDAKQALTNFQAVFQTDPTSQSIRRAVARCQAHVGETYVRMAFQPRATGQHRLALCRQANSWLQKALPELLQNKNVSGQSDDQFVDTVQKQIDRCDKVISQHDHRNQAPTETQHP